MTESKHFKKFFQQRSILDSLRMHLDITDDFLFQLRSSNILDDEELDLLKSLRFPANRNELMQILVKKQWDNDSMGQFCTTLKATQGTALGANFVQKAETYMEASDKEREKEIEARKIQEDYQTIFPVTERGSMGLQDQTKMLYVLKEKDDLIRQLSAQNEEMKLALQDLQDEHDDMKARFTELDKSVQEMLATLGSSGADDSIEASLDALTSHVLLDRTQLVTLKQERLDHDNGLKEYELRQEALVKENADLEEKVKTLSEQLHEEQVKAATKIETLSRGLYTSKNKSNQLQRKVDGLQGVFGSNIRELEHDLMKTRKQLSEKTSDMERVLKEQDRIKKEMKDVKERTRKLLFTLGLPNDIGKIGMSLEHARNISYAIRRRGSMAQNKQSVENNGDGGDIQALTDIMEMLKVMNSESTRMHSSEVTTPRSMDESRSTIHLQPINGSSQDTDVNFETVTALSHNDSSSNQTLSSFGRSVNNYISQPSSNQQHTPRLVKPTPSKEMTSVKCLTCGRVYSESSNHDKACCHHQLNAIKLYEGTKLEVWSCCKSRDLIKGCLKGRHHAT